MYKFVILCVAIVSIVSIVTANGCVCTIMENPLSMAVCTGCSSFPSSQLHNHKDIVSLHLNGTGGNTLTYLPKLVGFKYLDLLDVSNNNIEDIADAAFEECALITLNLTGNSLTNISSIMFKGTESLLHLHLDGNNIRRLDEADLFREYSKNLMALYLNNNQIEFMHDNAVNDLPNLTILDLSGNHLKRHSGLHFKGLRSLKRLYLHKNEVTNLTANAFNDVPSLELLDLSTNQIEDIQDMAFQGLSNLRVLHLSYNRIKIIHGEFRYLAGLETLFINYNPIEEIQPDSMPAALQNINLENTNELEIIPNNTFRGVKNLIYVYITGNGKLSTIDIDAFDKSGKAKIQVLDLSNNALEHLDKDTLLWENITSLKLDNNNWDCDCSISWMRFFLRETTQRQIKCVSPTHLRGKSIADLEFDQFSCNVFVRYRRSLAISLIVIVTILFLMFSGFLIYRKRRIILPCVYKTEKNYQTLYNSGDSDDNAVTVDYVEEMQGPPPQKPKREFRDSTPRVAAV